MISQTAEYALRAIVCLGNARGVPRTTLDIASAIRAPVGYLAKIMHQLTRSGLVESRRGLHGGFVLAREAARMTMHDVVEAVDPADHAACPLDENHRVDGLCQLHVALEHAVGQMVAVLRRTTIADLVEVRAPVAPCDGRHCRFPNDVLNVGG